MAQRAAAEDTDRGERGSEMKGEATMDIRLTEAEAQAAYYAAHKLAASYTRPPEGRLLAVAEAQLQKVLEFLKEETRADLP